MGGCDKHKLGVGCRWVGVTAQVGGGVQVGVTSQVGGAGGWV